METKEALVAASETTHDLIEAWERKNRQRKFTVTALPPDTKLCLLVLAVNSAATVEDRAELVAKAKLVPGVIDAVLPLSGDVPEIPATFPEGCTVELIGTGKFEIAEPPKPKQPG